MYHILLMFSQTLLSTIPAGKSLKETCSLGLVIFKFLNENVRD